MKIKQNEQKRLTVYTSESLLRSPVTFIRLMWEDLLNSRELAWRLFVRDIKARYRHSLLGILWAFIPPIVSTIIFVIMNNKGIINVGKTDIPYPAYVLFGTVLWQLFTDSLNAPIKMVAQNKAMLAKINFPREALIISSMAEVLFNFLIKLIIVVITFIIFDISATWGILVAPFSILMIMLLGIVIGLFLTPLSVLYTDITSGLTVIMGFWFLITPVIYPPPQTWPFSLLNIINPVSPLLVGTRELVTRGTMSDPLSFIIVSGITLLGLFVMWVVYRISLSILIERMSA